MALQVLLSSLSIRLSTCIVLWKGLKLRLVAKLANSHPKQIYQFVLVIEQKHLDIASTWYHKSVFMAIISTSVPGTKSVVFSSPYCFTVKSLLSSVGLPCNEDQDFTVNTKRQQIIRSFGFVYITKFSNKYESASELILELRLHSTAGSLIWVPYNGNIDCLGKILCPALDALV